MRVPGLGFRSALDPPSPGGLSVRQQLTDGTWRRLPSSGSGEPRGGAAPAEGPTRARQLLPVRACGGLSRSPSALGGR